ncbi:AlpA family phage regulatory protein [Pseudomonas synxantha]|uniref:AlpA family phage regulatory protein n=1 Tax=Pseudomonas synxantha TaxID=47883 RepID=A0A5D3GIK9_9PSED|nr:AlpA family phage regulatory protein [Pseudomonas synxantha]
MGLSLRHGGVYETRGDSYIGEGTFPKPVSLGDRCVGWVESEVHDWILGRIEERDLAESAAARPGRLSMAS